MKILHVIPFFSPKKGGSVTVLYDLSKELVRLGHEITILTTDYKFDQSYIPPLKNIQVIPFKCVFKFFEIYYSPSIIKWLEEHIQSYDLVHLHNFRSYQNIPTSRIAVKYQIPYIVQPHGSLPLIIEKLFLKKLYDRFWGNKILQKSSKIIAVSKSEIQQIRQFGIAERNITLIPNGLTTKIPVNVSLLDQFKTQYNIREKQIILYVGRLHKRKGIDFLISAFQKYIESFSKNDVGLVIVGNDDGYKSFLKDFSKKLNLNDKVYFLDHIPSVEAAYLEADILIYPSTYEIFGLVPFEAIICGTPIIVTDDCGCGEIIKEAECGYLVHYGDVTGMSEKIKYALEHQEENEKMVQAGRLYITENLSWEKIVKKVETLYQEVL